ncbi:nicotinate-nucleotide--dimethylbenzimidazole phosphoribosyltransferase [Klebsiella pneumoniae]|uniref:Nicotinate-nucleotide--dimethylbenzimidazole phosphoribosyltransferase n=1 Tax=Klebsiella pneumoniae TaxID=573 RepID=A0A377XDY3_KLEPN|nr:nicotinate-nucleotide--dimethylbenzimidazole phosphoribosyltransferase [Klebsiella pneumoniae]
MAFFSYAAALAACQIAPEVKPYLIPSHYSAEKGARIALAHLGSNRISIWACVWEKQRRGAGDADRRGGLRDVPSHGHAGGKQYCVTEGVSRRWGRQWPFPFSAEVLPAAETKKHP